MNPDKIPTKPIDLYVRVSQVGGRDVEADGGTAASQEKRCRAYLESKGLRAGKVFKDLDVSGGTMTRPAFDQVVERARTGVSGGLIMINLKRFGRRAKAAELAIKLEQEHGAAVIAVEDDLDTTTAMGRAMIRIVATFAELELDHLSEGWERVQSSRIERGLHSGVPLGYQRDETGKLVANGYADAVRQAFRARADGAAWPAVAEILNASGARTRFGGETWSESSARALIRNRVYLGEARYGDRVAEDAHEPLTDEETFRLANRRVPRKLSRGDRAPRLLAGLVKCAGCGYGMSYSTTSSAGRRYEFLRCQSSPSCTARATASREKLEDLVLDALLANTPDEIPVEFEFAVEDERAAELQAAVTRARALVAEAEDLIGTKLPETAKQARALQAAIAAQDEHRPRGRTVSYSDVVKIRHPETALDRADQRELLLEEVERVEVTKGRGGNLADRVEIVWRGEAA